jgi:hypothetical protein
MIKFQLPAVDRVGIPAGQPKGLNLVCPLSHAAILRYEMENGFEGSL